MVVRGGAQQCGDDRCSDKRNLDIQVAYFHPTRSHDCANDHVWTTSYLTRGSNHQMTQSRSTLRKHHNDTLAHWLGARCCNGNPSPYVGHDAPKLSAQKLVYACRALRTPQHTNIVTIRVSVCADILGVLKSETQLLDRSTNLKSPLQMTTTTRIR